MKNIFYPQKMVFFASLIMSIFMCLSSDTFLGIWMSMEINMFTFIPFISTDKNFNNEKSTMLYFLIQSISSSLILFSMISLSISIYMKNSITMLFMISIMTKMGVFPFYSWMIVTMENLSWNMCFMILTIQKIIPLLTLMSLYQKKIILMLCFMNSFTASIKGLTMFSLRKIMGFSSMNHLSLLIISMSISKKLFKMYFLIYSIMTFSCTKMFSSMKMNFLFQTMKLMKMNKTNNLIIMTLILSMAGVPPFLGFIPKALVIMKMMEMKMLFLGMSILILNTLSTFFYLRMTMTNFLMNMNVTKNKNKEKINKFPLYIILTPLTLILWNFKLKKLLIFKIKIKKNYISMKFIQLLSMMITMILALMAVAFITLLERKILGYMQMRLGPNKVGNLGLLQPISDAVKLYTKEMSNPKSSNFLMFLISPSMSISLAIMIWTIMPFLKPILNMKMSLLMFLAILGLGVYPIIMAGWSSNSNYSLMGSMRALAQTISYEVSLVFIILSNMFLLTTMSFFNILMTQKFFINLMFIINFLLWMISIMGELNRTPFDFAEGESELVSGFNTEYSSGTFAIIFMAEYMMILFFSFFSVVMFLGQSIHMFNMMKIMMIMFFIIWVRATLPRYRYDKLMNLSWKFILPISTMNLFLTISISIILK